jgi:hypothetical protein
MQVAALKYAEIGLPSLLTVFREGWLHDGLGVLLRVLIVLVAINASTATLFGLEAINDQLWHRWVVRRAGFEKER